MKLYTEEFRNDEVVELPDLLINEDLNVSDESTTKKSTTESENRNINIIIEF